MILLDTNVLSELMRSNPSKRVLAWTKAQRAEVLFTSSVTEAEVLHGIELLPAGRRRASLLLAAKGVFDIDFAGRVLPFDSAAAAHYATIATKRKVAGRPISQFDAQIAAIAARSKLAVATRNVRDFEACGVELINPFDG
jgi:predicted nucleic acid-binding protein